MRNIAHFGTAVLAFIMTVVAGSGIAPLDRGADTNSLATAATTSHGNYAVEPRAGTWKTWVLESPRQLRLSAPPSDRTTVETELRTLRALAASRNSRVRMQI